MTTRPRYLHLVAAICGLACATSIAGITFFFDSTQVATPVSAGVTSDAIRSYGYVFTCTRDKLFTGGVGLTEPIGRTVRIPWPLGVEAQAVTTPPPGVTDHKARITLRRVDGRPFDLTAFTATLLANTGGAGGAIEIMPMLNGEDGLPDPLYFDATGYYGGSFSYNTSPNYLGSTAQLKGFDTYKISLYVDFALTSLTLESAVVPGDFNADGCVDQADIDALRPCVSGPAVMVQAGCEAMDLDFDNDVDQDDFSIVQRCFSGTGVPADPNCG